MREWGLFNDEGCVEAGFYSEGQAVIARDTHYDEEDGLTVREVCPDHEEQPLIGCEECGNE